MEIQAQVGSSGTELARLQGCHCLLGVVDKKCLVHGKVVAYGVEYTYLGKRHSVESRYFGVHHIKPIKYEVKFYKTLYEAVGESSIVSLSPIDTCIFVKELNGRFRQLDKEENKRIEDIQMIQDLEVAGL